MRFNMTAVSLLLLFLALAFGCSDEIENPTTDGDGGNSNCNTLDIELCESYAHCRVVSGIKADAENNCKEPEPIAVGCMSKEQDCIPDVMINLDLDGNCWIFPDTCVPMDYGWAETDLSGDDPNAWCDQRLFSELPECE